MHSASQTAQICTCISIDSICGDVGIYEQEGGGGEGYNGIDGDCERGNAVIEDILELEKVGTSPAGFQVHLFQR